MDSAEAISAFRLVVAIVILAIAAVLDIRTRKVGNAYWIAMAVIGLALLPVQISIDDKPWEYLVIIVPILAILSDVYLEAKPGTRLEKYGPGVKYAIAIVAIGLLGYYLGEAVYFQHLLAVPVLMLAVVAMYMLDMISGGADAKAIVSLCVLFPFYPDFGGLPAIQADTELATIVFPFALTVLIVAAIIVALVMPLGFLLVNVASRDLRFPNAFFGRKMDVDKAMLSHVWLMERMKNGEHVDYIRPRRDEVLSRELDLLRNAGFSRVWVTPKIPFMVPLLASIVISATVGNFLFLVFSF